LSHVAIDKNFLSVNNPQYFNAAEWGSLARKRKNKAQEAQHASNALHCFDLILSLKLHERPVKSTCHLILVDGFWAGTSPSAV
jgi:hypothetical protein